MSEAAGAAPKRGAFSTFAHACQFFFGGWFLFHGLNYWLAFYADTTILPGPGLIPALVASGVMTVVKVLEIVIGLALLADLCAPLAIVAAWPITLMIAWVNASHLRPFGVSVALIIIFLNAIMSFGHLDRYRAMLAISAGPPNLHGFRGGGAKSTARLALLPHLIAAVAGIAAATGVTFWSLMR
ncbi:MAG: hypothetical protein JNJ73_14845 [Hyphomonadaceae bacterium]|nr:hypothetical protein [Hyphomonadaceae bacterium]